MPHSDPPQRRQHTTSSSSYRTSSYGAIPTSDPEDVFVIAPEAPAASHSDEEIVEEKPRSPRRLMSVPAQGAPREKIKWRSETVCESPQHPAFIAPPYLFPSMNTLADIEHEQHERAMSVIEDKDEAEILPPLTRKQKVTMFMMAFANFCSTVTFSLIAPFYPTEAKLKGATPSQVGIVFGIFELCMFLVSPILGRYMSKIGSKFMFSTGLFVTGVTAILFGTLNWSPPGSTFLALSLVIRIVESVGDAAFMTASFAITAHSFPGRISRTIGILEVFSGLGFTAGPPIGGALYQLGGYGLPFFVVGGMLIVASGISTVMLDNFPDDSRKDAQGILGLIRRPSIMLMISAIVVCALSLSFIDPTLAPHLAQFNLTPFTVGLVFLLCGGVYTVTGPVWGYVIDRWTYTAQLFMICGALLAMIAMLLIGPSPILHIEKSLWVIGLGLAMLGLAIGALFIPTFQTTLNMARAAGYPDSIETYGCVSGLFQSCFSFGGFFGPTVGGILVEAITFEWTGTLIGGIHLLVGISLSTYYVYTHRCQGQTNKKDALKIDADSPDSGLEDITAT